MSEPFSLISVVCERKMHHLFGIYRIVNVSINQNQTLSILAVLHGHNGLMWLAAVCALACLLLEHVVAAIQL